MSKYKYKRVLLKLSGEALAAKDGSGYDTDLIANIADEIKGPLNNGVEIAIVIGGGNIVRGMTASKYGLDRSNADYMGMLATIINAMALEDGFKNVGLPARSLSSIPMPLVTETYIIKKARKYLSKGEVLILGGGTSVPYFTTDTNASLRACELKCDCVLKATKVDGVYDKDPEKHSDAKKFEELKYEEVLAKELRVMDLTATSMCMDNNIPVCVFNMSQKGNIDKVLQGENVGTLVC